jgi:hypothetical protein
MSTDKKQELWNELYASSKSLSKASVTLEYKLQSLSKRNASTDELKSIEGILGSITKIQADIQKEYDALKKVEE